jgi:hypothetical protein
MGNFYDATVEPDGRIRLKASIHLEKYLRVVAAVPGQDVDSAASGIVLGDFVLC